MVRSLLALLLLSCASTPKVKVNFLDSDGEKGAHVCIVQSKTELDCLTLKEFMRMARKAHDAEPESMGSGGFPLEL